MTDLAKTQIITEKEITAIKIGQETFLSHYTKTTQYSNRQNQNHRSSTPERQRQVNQVTATVETNPGQTGIENTETSE